MATLLLPGERLAGAEEAESGENTYIENDEVYSAAIGEDRSVPGKAAVHCPSRVLQQPEVGMEVYGIVIKASMNKAIVGCISVNEAEGKGRGVQFDAVLPVTAIRAEYVREIRDEVRIGDIIRAKVEKVSRSGVDLSMLHTSAGVVCAYCPKCRTQMGLEGELFVCKTCEWRDRRKLPGQVSEGRRRSEYGGGRGNYSGGERRGGFGGERRGRFGDNRSGGRPFKPRGQF